MRTNKHLACLALLCLATTVSANEQLHEPDLSRPEEPVPFLLRTEQRPSTTRILPPAPAAGSARYEADRKVFKDTRALRDTPRWQLARHDVALDVASMLENFSCAIGTRLTPIKAPMLAGLLTRVSADAERAIEPPKAANRRARPFTIDDGAICEAKEKLTSFDYPSGHATWGWTVGLLLAELAPDRSTAVLVRARTYGESRVVCGAHNLSAIEAGATNAAALVAGLHGSPEFRVAMDAVRGELVAARAADTAGPDVAACAVETAAEKAGY